MESQKILNRAAELVTQGWCKMTAAKDELGRHVPPTHPNACRWCATGAIDKAVDDIIPNLGRHEQAWEVNRLAKYVQEANGIVCLLHRWNDSEKTTQEQVIQVLKYASECWGLKHST